MTDEIQRCYRVLGLTPGEPLDGVKRAFRRLVKQWHPDRFNHDPQPTRTANENLKELIPAIRWYSGAAQKGFSQARIKLDELKAQQGARRGKRAY